MHKEEIAYNKGYYITPDGTAMGLKGFPLRVKPNNWGRLEFTIRDGQRYRSIKVHRLQAYQKFGQKLYEPDMVVRHQDNNYLNNSWDNILIGTQSQNMMDLSAEERIRKSKIAANKLKKLSDDEVRQLRKDSQQMTYPQLIYISTIWPKAQ